MAEQKRFWITMLALLALGVLEWFTLSPEPVRLVPGPHGEPLLRISVRGLALAVLGLFAFRAWIHQRRRMLEEQRGSGQERSALDSSEEVPSGQDGQEQGRGAVRGSGRE
jgi:hypothetical protein